MTEPPIVLYTQAGCAESRRVREWLTERAISFAERDAGTDPEAALALAATGSFATPLLVIGGRTVLGYRPEELASAVGRRPGP